MSNRKPFIRPGYARCVDCACEVKDNPDAINVCDDCRESWEAELSHEVALAEDARRTAALLKRHRMYRGRRYADK